MALNHHFREVLLGIIEKKEKERIYFIENGKKGGIYYEREEEISERLLS